LRFFSSFFWRLSVSFKKGGFDALAAEAGAASATSRLLSNSYWLVVMDAERLTDPIDKLSNILHEIAHLKGFLALEAGDDLYKVYRSGVKVMPTMQKAERIGSFTAFIGLDEAIVSEIEKRHLPELIKKNKLLKGEYIWQTSSEATALKEEIAKKEGINPNEIMRISKDGQTYKCFSYYEQRRVLNHIVGRIYENNREKFDSADDVMRLFFRAHFSGELLSIARLIEESFGKGAFRMVGMMDDNTNSARLIMDYLKKKSPEV